MAGRRPPVTTSEPLGIVELVDAAAGLTARFGALSEVLGRWATDADDIADDSRRRYGTMSHRHAWHADLWRARTPAIPIEPAAVDPIGAPDTPDEGWYRSVVDRLERDAVSLRERAHRDLDPSTRWAADLTLGSLR